MARAYITVGLGFGDEGKGATVDYLCRQFGAKLVVRYSGGAQCGHNVIGPDSGRLPFAQFGAGTFAGVPTYLAQSVVVDPYALFNEADAIQKAGVELKTNSLTINENCVVATPLHALLNQEDAGNVSHGTCGRGIGKAREHWIKYGEDVLMAGDCCNYNGSTFDRKLELLRNRILLETKGQLPWNAFNEAFLKTQNMRHMLVAGWLTVRMSPYAATGDAPIVFEGAQGILLDQTFGRSPHTTWSDVTPRLARDLCRNHKSNYYYDFKIDEVVTIGVTRAYATRHGDGPFPTEVPSTDSVFQVKSDPGNPFNKWQKGMRFGYFDMALFKYAVQVCNYYSPLDYLAVNHLDEMSDGVTYYDTPEENPTGSVLWESARTVSRKLACNDFIRKLSSIVPVGLMGYGPAYDQRACLIK